MISLDSVAKRIYDAIQAAGLSYGTLSQMTHIPKSALQRYATGETEKCPLSRLEAIAAATGVTPAYLMGWDALDEAVSKAMPWYTPGKGTVDEQRERLGLEAIPKMRKVPLVGDIACGVPITAEENIEGYVNVPLDVSCDFVLRCVGDSMAPHIMDGDLVYIRVQPDVEDGQIAAVQIDGERATLKHVYHLPSHDGIQLVSENHAYAPMIHTADNSEDLRILGLAVAFQRSLV